MGRKPDKTAADAEASAERSRLALEIEQLRGRLAQQAQDCEQRLAAATATRAQLEQTMSALSARCQGVTTALDAVSANVMMIDADERISQLNRSLQTLFQSHAGELRRELPGFDASSLPGSPVGPLIGAATPALMLGGLQAPKQALLKIAGLTLSLTATPVFDTDGK